MTYRLHDITGTRFSFGTDHGSTLVDPAKCLAKILCTTYKRNLKILLIDKLLLGTKGITFKVDLVISLTLFIEIIFAKIVGCTLPIFAKKLNFDPAVMSSPFITTIVDALSLLIYFGLSTAILHI